jgi:hypothetical protein
VTNVTLAIFLALLGQAEDAAARNEIAIGERLVAAIKGEAEFEDSDFAKPLGEGDKVALRRFAKCKVKNIGHVLIADPTRPNVLVRKFNDVSVRLDCKGVPWGTPAGISLHLQDGKIARIETHNADLMRAN